MGNRGGNPHHASKSKIFCRVSGPCQSNLETVPSCSSQGSHVNGDTSGNMKECQASILLGLGGRSSGKHPVSQKVGVNLSREVGAAGEKEMASEEWRCCGGDRRKCGARQG